MDFIIQNFKYLCRNVMLFIASLMLYKYFTMAIDVCGKTCLVGLLIGLNFSLEKLHEHFRASAGFSSKKSNKLKD